MKTGNHRIRIVLVLAVAVVSLALASGASAKFMPEDSGVSGIPVTTSPAPVQITSNDGFNWGSALAGAGVAVAAALGIAGTGYLVRSRSRLAT